MTKQLTYGNVFIGSWEDQFIDMLEDLALEIVPELDINNAPIYPGQSVTIANDVIRYIYEECIFALDISEKSKNKLAESLYINSIDSWVDTNIEEFPKNERDAVYRILSIERKIRETVSNRNK